MAVDFDSLLPKIMDLLLDTVCVVDAEGYFVFVSAACERLFGYTQEELIGRNMIEYVHPEDRERTLAVATEVMRDHPHMNFENRYVRKDGRIVYVMWSARWSAPDRLRLAVARDVTALKRTEQVQRALYRISEAAHAAEGLHALCEDIHKVVGDLLPADDFRVALYDASDATLSYAYAIEEPASGRKPRPLETGAPITEVIRTGRALLTTRSDTGTMGEPGPAGSRNGGNWLGVPLISLHGVMGALVVRNHAGHARYTEEDRELLQFVSDRVTSAIEHKQAQARLHYMAHHDALTGVPNRTLFNERLDAALIRARRNGARLALLYLDLDTFKEINDTYGHEAGDRLLHAVAQRIAECVRESDTVGRMGGDEFALLLTNIRGPDAVNILVGKIRARLLEPFELDGHTLTVSVSIGAAIYPDHGDNRALLFRHADADMYGAKGKSNST